MPLCLAFGTGEGLLWYGICVPYSKKASWGTRRIFRGVPCQKQPPAAPDASSVRETAPALFVRSGGPFPCSFDGTRYQKRPPLGGEQT